MEIFIQEDYAEIIETILEEVHRAERLYPNWPTDMIHATAILSEETGEAVQASNNFWHHGGARSEVVKEVVQSAATAVRWLLHDHKYEMPIPETEEGQEGGLF